MTGVKGRSGGRRTSKKAIDKLLSFSDTVALRAIKNEEIPLLERAKLALQVSLKKIADRTEAVVVNLNLSDEIAERLLARLENLNKTESYLAKPPKEIYVEVVPDKPEDSEDNKPEESSSENASNATYIEDSDDNPTNPSASSSSPSTINSPPPTNNRHE